MSNINEEYKLVSQREAVTKSYKKLQSDRKREWGLGGISTGIKDIDLSIGGFLPQKINIFAARSGIGKTALVNSFIAGGSTVRDGRKASFLVFSWELDSSLLVTREVCRLAGVTQGLLLNGSKLLGEEKLKEIDKIYKKCTEYEVQYQQISTDINVVTKLVDEFTEQCKIKDKEDGLERQPVIIIDFINMSKALTNTLKTYQMLEFASGAKQSANRTGSAYAILAQLGRGADEKAMPTRNDLADSRSLEDMADSVSLFHRPEYNNVPLIYNPKTGEEDTNSEGKILLIVVKSREFGTRMVLMNVDIKHFRFWSIGTNWDYDFYPEYSRKQFWMDHFGLRQDEKQLNLDQNR